LTVPQRKTGIPAPTSLSLSFPFFFFFFLLLAGRATRCSLSVPLGDPRCQPSREP
jgi:hypothetical protein